MKFGKTHAELDERDRQRRLEEKKLREWHMVMTWWPTRLTDGRTAWLERIWQRYIPTSYSGNIWGTDWHDGYWERKEL